jgi:hypothetical protein
LVEVAVSGIGRVSLSETVGIGEAPGCRVPAGAITASALATDVAKDWDADTPGTYRRWLTKIVFVFKQLTRIRVSTSVP